MTDTMPAIATRKKVTTVQPRPLKRILEKALDEVSMGDPQSAEALIELAIHEEKETSVIIALLVNTLKLAQERLEINNYSDEENEYLDAVTSAIAQAIGGAI